MDPSSPVYDSFEPLRLYEGHLGRPVAAKAAPHGTDMCSIHVGPFFQVVHRHGKGALCVWFVGEQRALPRPWHIDGECGQAKPMKSLASSLAILLPAVYSSPVHDHRRAIQAARNLQIADHRLVFKRDLNSLDGWIEVFGCFEVIS